MGKIAMKSRIYLDHAATTPACAVAIAALAEAAAVVGNPSSVHHGGREANGIVERARDQIADWAGCQAAAIVFTSGGSEALALALNTPLRVLAAATEHSAVLAARADIGVIAVDRHGVIDFDALDRALAAGPALVAVQQANNETGVIQPLADIAARVAAAGGQLLVDAVQSAGKLPLPDADYVVISAHKLGGVPGVGALIARNVDRLVAVQRGGGQERGVRGGTPNLPGIAAFAAAVGAAANVGTAANWARITALREALEARLGAVVHGAGTARLPNISNIALPGVAGSTQVMTLDLAGIMVSAGAACASGKVTASHVLAAMGLGVAAGQAIRVSLGLQTTAAEVTAFGDAWCAMAQRLARAAA
jgi:cysteine desulfurase